MTKDLDSLIAAAGIEVAVVGPASEEKVHDAERLLGVIFPPSYKAFLEKYGAVEIDGRSFAGLTAGDAGSVGDVVAFTRHARESYALPARYVALDLQDGDAFLCLDTEQRRADGESPVVLVSPIDGAQMGPVVADTVTDYLTKYLSS